MEKYYILKTKTKKELQEIKNFGQYVVYYDGKVNGEFITNACKYDDYFKALKFYKNLACTYMLIEDTDIQISLIEHTKDFKRAVVDKYISIQNK